MYNVNAQAIAVGRGCPIMPPLGYEPGKQHCPSTDAYIIVGLGCK